MIGKSLGRYRITSKLGEGGMGSVWLAEDSVLGRSVALKLLASHLATSESARVRFVREARAASRLAHAGIATVFDAGETGDQVYIAYQLVEGDTLAKRLAAGPLPLHDLLRLARGAAEALAHAHGRDVLHRDLSAGNIMLDADNSPVIVDFGLARTRGDVTLTSTGTTLGTAPYMAPEQWRGEAGDAKTDLWALGVVLYYAATGQQPFGADAPEAVMYRVLNDEPARPTTLRPELPPEFERLVLRLLEKDARDRLASAAELAGAMQAIASTELQTPGEPVSGETPVARIRRWWRKQTRRRFTPAQVVAAITMVLAVAVGSVLLYARFAPHAEKVLAVMPMRNTSQDPEETAHLGEALGEELVRRIGASGALHLLPWSTTVAFDGRSMTPQKLAQALRADLLLRGSYRSDGETIEVLAELVDGRNGLQVWSERYSRPAGELIDLQSELAIAVAQRAAPSFDATKRERIASSAAGNPAAYENYIRGANYLNAPDEASQALAEPFFRMAVQLDSTLAVAWVGLGAIRATSYFSGGPGGRSNLNDAEEYFKRALAIEPDLPQAERGLIRVASDAGNFEAGLQIGADALTRDPDAVESQVTAGWAFTLCGLPGLAVPMFDRSLDGDRNNQGAAWFRIIALSWNEDDRECLERGRDYVQRFGEDAEVYTWMALSAAGTGERAKAVTLLERAVELNQSGGYAASYLAGWYRTNRDGDKLRALGSRVRAELEAKLAEAPDNLRIRCLYAAFLVDVGDTAAISAQLGILGEQFRRGNLATGGQELDFIFSLAQTGHMELARRALSSIPTTTLGDIFQVQLAERHACYVGAGTERLMETEEYRAVRARYATYHAKLLATYRPLVDRVFARWARARNRSAGGGRG